MAERAAHLVDHVFPQVRIRQWVLSLPHRLRFRLAWDHTLCRAVLGRTLRAILGFLRRRARDAGVTDGRSGAVTIVQRFGGALNTNIHFHAFVLDGVFAEEGDGLRFHPCPWLDAGDVADVVATVEAYLHRLLGTEAEEASDQSSEGWADEAPVLAGLAAASVQGRAAVWRQVLLPLNVNYSCRFGRLLVRRRTVRWALLRVLKTQKTKRRERPLGDVHGVR